MPEQKLEFRGIKREHLGLYFEELGGVQKTNSFPFIYEGATWSAHILSEDELTFTSVFKVNAVIIRFTADNEETLDGLIKNYRYKTTRIGG